MTANTSGFRARLMPESELSPAYFCPPLSSAAEVGLGVASFWRPRQGGSFRRHICNGRRVCSGHANRATASIRCLPAIARQRSRTAIAQKRSLGSSKPPLANLPDTAAQELPQSAISSSIKRRQRRPRMSSAHIDGEAKRYAQFVAFRYDHVCFRVGIPIAGDPGFGGNYRSKVSGSFRKGATVSARAAAIIGCAKMAVAQIAFTARRPSDTLISTLYPRS